MSTPTLPRPMHLAAFVAAAALAVSACSSDTPAKDVKKRSPTTDAPKEGSKKARAVIDPGDGGNYDPKIDPADFTTTIDNPYLPMLPGARWTYGGTSDAKPEETEIVVLDEKKTVMGVPVVVVRDTVTSGGELKEDTIDWFAQDRDGNVWYFGEEVKDYENGKVSSTAGSWEAGVDGAVPGIVMPAKAEKGKAYRQEFQRGEAEDMFEILAVDTTTRANGRDYDQVIRTEDWTPLEPEVVEHKTYAPGVGMLSVDYVAGGQEHVELVSHTPGRAR